MVSFKYFLPILLTAAACASEPKVISVWPGAAPGSESWNYEEQVVSNVVTNVTHPTLTVYLPDPALATGTAVIICPGGGFRRLMFDFEGSDLAHWLNSIGVAGIVLKYRLLHTGAPDDGIPAVILERRKKLFPLIVADGQQAIRVVRARAAEWGIATDRIGILGFSAGGYVAAAVALQQDAASRPNFAAPIYPFTDGDVTPPNDAPPLFLVHANDDTTLPPLDHTIRLYSAWNKAKISVELHIYAHGGHGFGVKKNDLPVDRWPDQFREWLRAQGYLKSR
jgi:acetyl esterase/lipase